MGSAQVCQFCEGVGRINRGEFFLDALPEVEEVGLLVWGRDGRRHIIAEVEGAGDLVVDKDGSLIEVRGQFIDGTVIKDLALSCGECLSIVDILIGRHHVVGDLKLHIETDSLIMGIGHLETEGWCIGREPHPVVDDRHLRLEFGSVVLVHQFHRCEGKADTLYETAVLLEFGKHAVADDDIRMAAFELGKTVHARHLRPVDRTEDGLGAYLQILVTQTKDIPRNSLGEARSGQQLIDRVNTLQCGMCPADPYGLFVASATIALDDIHSLQREASTCDEETVGLHIGEHGTVDVIVHLCHIGCEDCVRRSCQFLSCTIAEGELRIIALTCEGDGET